MSLYGAIDKQYLVIHTVTAAEDTANSATMQVIPATNADCKALFVHATSSAGVVRVVTTTNITAGVLTVASSALALNDIIYALAIPNSE